MKKSPLSKGLKTLISCCTTFFLLHFTATAQGVSINSDGSAPDNSAMLDVKSPASPGLQMGILFPRVNLANAFNATPATHLFGVNTNTAFNAGSRFNSGMGLYRFDGTRWNRLLESTDSTMFWGTGGNAISPGDFLGTTNNQNLIIKTAADYTGSGITPAYGTKITVPWRPNEYVSFSNVRGLSLPLGSEGAPSLVFTPGIIGVYGITGGGNFGIALRLATNLYSFFTQNGLRITTSGAPSNLLAESSMLDVAGNIYTRGKIVYSEHAAVMISASNPEKTFKNEIYWDGTIALNANSPTFWDENAQLRLQVGRDASGYFLQIATTTVRTFTCVNNLGEVINVTTTANINDFHAIKFTTPVTSNGAQTITIRQQSASAAMYQIILIVSNDNVGVALQRWQN